MALTPRFLQLLLAGHSVVDPGQPDKWSGVTTLRLLAATTARTGTT